MSEAVAVGRVGFVGLGKMGLPMARRVAAAGYAVAGYDTNAKTCGSAAAAGIRIAGSPAELASSCDMVLVIVGFERQVEDVLFGADGIVAGARPGAVVAVASTISPRSMVSLAERLVDRALHVLDVPVARGEAAAQSGALLVYAGGADAVLASCRPVLDCFSEHIVHLGAPGAGQVAKAVNNMLLWTCLSANVEGLAFAEAFGIEREALRAALRLSSGANWALETRADERPALWAEKDLTILLGEADRVRLAMPVAATVKEAIKAFKIARGLPMRAEEG